MFQNQLRRWHFCILLPVVFQAAAHIALLFGCLCADFPQGTRAFSHPRTVEFYAKARTIPTTTTTTKTTTAAAGFKIDGPFWSERDRHKLKMHPGSSDMHKVERKENKDDTDTEKEDNMNYFRLFRQHVRYLLRDAGIVRSLMDFGFFLSIPGFVKVHPSALHDFLELSTRSLPCISQKLARTVAGWLPDYVSSRDGSLLGTNFTAKRLSYGQDSRQFVDLFEPSYDNKIYSEPQQKRLVMFVHGGGWGSGFPAMYRLISVPFLNRGFSFAVVGYRTYPAANCDGQTSDIVNAAAKLLKGGSGSSPTETNGYDDITLIAHSSGAHISMMAFFNEATASRWPTCRINRFISLAGIFDIPTHYGVEAHRYIERLSPMSPTCADVSVGTGTITGTQQQGWTPQRTLKNWKCNSPSRIIANDPLLAEENLPQQTLLIHGELDTTVPASSSKDYYSKAMNLLGHGVPKENSKKSTELHILPRDGHVDVVLHLMFGGKTLDIIMNCLSEAESRSS